MTHTITFEFTGEITDEDIDNVLSCAFEGGINYWCTTMVRVPEWPEGNGYASDVVSKNKPVEIYVEDEEKWEVLNLEKFLKGLVKFLQFREVGLNYITYGYYDAGDADLIVQFALFDKIVYG